MFGCVIRRFLYLNFTISHQLILPNLPAAEDFSFLDISLTMNTTTYPCEAAPFSSDWFNAKHMSQQQQQQEQLSVGKLLLAT
ncbi:unnamed protein product [Gongylonema pulchrum]|uniref:Uncharacterized protein n=1 Tax=Gongylonema pulchrum TaxID=637853 RepID=A0A183E6N1_9BILA|nr:unnamed protein product [Gongylonema pulchrum]